MDHATQTQRTMEEARAALEVLAAARGLIDEDSLRARAEAILNAAGIPAPVEDAAEDATEEATEDAAEDATEDATDRDGHTIREDADGREIRTIREVLIDAGYRETDITFMASTIGRKVKSLYVERTGDLPVTVPEEQPNGYTAEVAAYPHLMRAFILRIAEECGVRAK